MLSVWWLWVAVGLLLVMSEIFIGAFYVLWFGIGIIAAGFLTLAFPEINLGVQLAFGVGLGAILLKVCRKWCVADGNAEIDVIDQFAGGPGTLKVNAGNIITVQCKGTYWIVANPEVLPEADQVDGARVQVASIEANRATLAPSASPTQPA